MSDGSSHTASDLAALLAVRDGIDALARQSVSGDATLPRVELRDAGEAWRVAIEVPGLAQEDVEVAVQGRSLVVAGHRDAEDDESTLVFSERTIGPFQRTVDLPSEVDPSRATAHLSAGVLVLTLPKA